MIRKRTTLCVCLGVLLSFAACSVDHSVLAPRSNEAAQTALLARILFYGGILIFIVVMAAVALSVIGGKDIRTRLARPTTIFVGGVLFPLVTLTLLLTYGLSLISTADGDAHADTLRIDVKAEQWWWRVSYPTPGNEVVDTANEIRIPVDSEVELTLTSADVIHSFWIPQLAGKVDMIPGRENKLKFRATSTGIYRGQCAEYCGGAHALMGIRVVAVTKDNFDAWLAKIASPSREAQTEKSRKGQTLFLQRGCSACHRIKGTSAVGMVGPSLTHVAGRDAIAAEVLPMSEENLRLWIAHSHDVKPNNRMPSFEQLPAPEIEALAAYLAELR
jgi:cytochrome c oxidase subunit 2